MSVESFDKGVSSCHPPLLPGYSLSATPVCGRGGMIEWNWSTEQCTVELCMCTDVSGAICKLGYCIFTQNTQYHAPIYTLV